MILEKKAAIIASLTAFILVIIKLIVGILSGSVAVLASAIDSILDIAVSVFNYFTLHTVEKGADERFNFGRGKLEPIAAVVEGVIIALSGLFILYQSIIKMSNSEKTLYLGESVAVMIISVILTYMLVLYLAHVANKTGSMVIRSDLLHYKTDLYTNGAILVALLLIQLTNYHLIDAIMGAAIALYIIYSAYQLIKDGTLMLMDVALDHEMVEQIEAIINSQSNVSNYHFLRTRRSGNDIFVSVHLVFNVSISLFDAHQISDSVEEKIEAIDSNKSWVFAIHLDPYDDSQSSEPH